MDKQDRRLRYITEFGQLGKEMSESNNTLIAKEGEEILRQVELVKLKYDKVQEELNGRTDQEGTA